MICSSCQFDNPEGLAFCGKCGNALKATCSKCTFHNPAEFSFCGKCGNKLTDGENQAISSPISASEFISEGERRHLTVMFCDLVGSTALSAELEPEELRNVVMEYQKMCQKVIAHFGGHIAQFLGDGILVYFGYPKATENDANSCVRSALGILDSLKGLNEQLKKSNGIEIAVRIGIHSGQTVIGDIEDPSGQSQHLAHGKTLNLAARLEGLAEANSIVISEDTFKLVEHDFIVEPKGEYELKGFDGRIPVFIIIGQKSDHVKRSRNIDPENGKPLVGRQKELSNILTLWEEVKQGDTQFAFVCGEAGIGKSKLISEIIANISLEQEALIIPHICSPYHKKTAYYAFVQTLKELALHVSGHESNEELLARLEIYLMRLQLEVEKILPLMANILGISISGSKYHPSNLSAPAQKNKLDQTFLKMLVIAAENRPVLLVFEDLHYADSATLDILGLFLQHSTAISVLGIMTYRPEFMPPWKRRPNQASVDLSSLGQSEVEQLIRRVAKNKELPQEVIEEIIKKTDGIPLFIEELTKMVIGSGALIETEDRYELKGQLSTLAIPSTLQDSLVSRLDKMSEGKRIAQLGATIGRNFNYLLTALIAQMDEEELQSNLNKLVEAEILIQSGFVPDSEYTFRHALIKDAAYSSLLKSQQKVYHQSIAIKLLEHFAQEVEEHPELVAYHFEKAECLKEAAGYWLKAGKNAKDNLVSEEALTYLDRALVLLGKLENGKEQGILELETLMIKAPLCFQRQGYTSEEAYTAGKRINEIAAEFDDSTSGFWALKNMVLYEIFTGNCALALEHALEALRNAETTNNLTQIIEAHRLIGHSYMFLGELQKSIDAFNRAISQYEKIEGSAEDSNEAKEAYLFSLTQRSGPLWKSGVPDQAVASLDRSRSMQNESSSVHLRTLTSFLYGVVYSFCGYHEKTLEAVQQVFALSEKHDTQWFVNDIMTFHGSAMINTGELEKGIETIIEGGQKRRKLRFSSGNIMHLSVGYGALKDNCQHADIKEYFRSMTKNQEKSDDNFSISEAHRIKAEMLAFEDAGNNAKEIEIELNKAESIAIKQGALSYELRNAVTRFKLKGSSQSKDHLKSVFERFKEGFNTHDLKEAQALLEINDQE